MLGRNEGAAGRVPREEGVPAVSINLPTGGGTMRTAGTVYPSAQTFLTHVFGRGLDDQRYVVERFRSDFEGQIQPSRPGKGSKGARNEARRVMSLRAVQRLRPERNEIIVATGVELAGGVQYYGDLACGLFASSKYR